VTVLCNTPPIVLTVQSVLDGAECQAITWLLVNSGFCTINIIGAFYIAAVISDENAYKGNVDAGNSAFERAKYAFCYDPKMAIFILVRMGFVAWLFMGLGSWGSYDGCEDIGAPVGTSLACGATFLSIGVIVFSFSLCCSNRGTRAIDPKQFAHEYVKDKVVKVIHGSNDQQPVVVEKIDQPYTAAGEDLEKQKAAEKSNEAYNKKAGQLPYMVIW